jgi:hypothetical protein
MNSGEEEQVLRDEEQEAQHALSIFISKASAIFTTFLSEQSFSKAEECGKLAQLLFEIKQGFEREIRRNQALHGLEISIGNKSSSRKNIPLTTIIKAFSSDGKSQRIASKNKYKTLVIPSIIPDLFIVQTSHENGGPTDIIRNYHLVGTNKLPEGYQPDLIPKK